MVAGLMTVIVLFDLLRGVAGRPIAGADPFPWRQALSGLGPLLLPLTGIIVVRSFVVSALTTYLPTFLSEEGSGLVAAGASLSLLEAAGVRGALLGGSASDRVGRRAVLFVSFIATPLLMGAFLTLEGWMRIPLLPLLGLSGLSFGPVIMALVQESLPGNRALANGLYMALSFVLRSGDILVIGVLATRSAWAGRSPSAP
jgi:FSR family fosmidomycin resistance protein-like MFS transporter